MRLILAVFLFIGLSPSAQMLGDVGLNPDEFLLDFRPEFISENNISSIQLEKSRKYTGTAFEKLQSSSSFYFDAAGEKYSQEKVESLFGRLDTTFHSANGGRSIEYSLKGCKLTYRSDENDAPIRISNYACECDLSDGKIEILDSNWVSGEFIVTRAIGEMKILREHQNSEGRPYLHQISEHDSLGYLLKSTEMFLTTRQKVTTRYKYDSHGLVKAIDQQNDLSKKQMTSAFSYDQFGTLTSYSISENGKETCQGELVIGDTALPEGAVEQRPGGEIIMYKFTYEFYD
jgi:YD repeat-containing protein